MNILRFLGFLWPSWGRKGQQEPIQRPRQTFCRVLQSFSQAVVHPSPSTFVQVQPSFATCTIDPSRRDVRILCVADTEIIDG